MNKKIVLTIAAVAIVGIGGIAAFALLMPKNNTGAIAASANSAAASASASSAAAVSAAWITENATAADTNFKKYWVDDVNVQAETAKELINERRDATPIEGERYLNDIFQVYHDNIIGSKFIISYTTRVYFDDTDGELPITCFDTLRREETGEKVYVLQNAAAVENVRNALKAFDEKGKGNKLSFADRTKIGHSFADAAFAPQQEIDLRINGIPALIDGSAVRVREGYVPLDQLCAVATQYGLMKGYTVTQNDCTFTIDAAGGEIKMQYQFDAGANSYKITHAAANGKEVACEQEIVDDAGCPGRAYVSLQHLGDAFGWDFDLYSDPACLNLVTDTKDIPTDDAIVLVASSIGRIATVISPIADKTGEETDEDLEFTGEGYDYIVVEKGPRKGEHIAMPSEKVWNEMSEYERCLFVAQRTPAAKSIY
ncbi:MAG: hypothetical protein RR284_08085 [Ruthenibacterium sp.]